MVFDGEALARRVLLLPLRQGDGSNVTHPAAKLAEDILADSLDLAADLPPIGRDQIDCTPGGAFNRLVAHLSPHQDETS